MALGGINDEGKQITKQGLVAPFIEKFILFSKTIFEVNLQKMALATDLETEWGFG